MKGGLLSILQGRQWLALAAIAGLLACSAPRQIEYERRVEETDPGAVHAVHDARLQELMQSIQRLADDRLPKSLDVDEPRRARAQEVVEIARALADSAERIPEASQSASMSATDRAAFEALARQLQEQATTLAAMTDGMQADEAEAALAAIQQTCRSCHARFRPL